MGIPGTPHHVIIHCVNAFRSDTGRCDYLSRLKRSAKSEDVRVLAYCVMANHIQVILVPGSERSVGYLFAKLGGGRYSCLRVDPLHIWSAIRYVECDPVRAGIVFRADEYTGPAPWPMCGA